MPSFAALRLRPYRRLLTAYTVNAAGDWLGEIALSVLVLSATGSVLAVSALWIAGRFVPAFVAPVLVGAAERRRPATLYLANALLYAGLVAGVLAGLPLPAVIALAFVDGVIALAARALTKTAIVAVTQPAGLLREGNAALSLAFTVSSTLGPVLGGVTVATFGVPAALALDGVTFALAGACLLRVPPAPAPERGESVLATVRNGVRHVAASPFLRRMIGADAAVAVLLATIIPVELVFVTQTLGATAQDYGTVLTAWGIGAVAGSAAMNLLGRASPAVLAAAGVVLMGAGYVGMGAAATVTQVVVFSALGGIGNGLEGLALATLVQERTPQRLQAQVNGLLESLHTAAPGAGYVLGGALAALASPRAVYWIGGLGALAVVAVAARALGGSLRAETVRGVVPAAA